MKSTEEGRNCEAIFETLCRYNGLICKRIHDGGIVTNAGIIRKSQVCDYIVAYKKTAFLIDVKKKPQRKLTRSFFNNGSTKTQFGHFLDLYKGTGFCFSGFVFVNLEHPNVPKLELLTTPCLISYYRMDGHPLIPLTDFIEAVKSAE